MNDSQIFRAAKEYLWNGKGQKYPTESFFICHAIALTGADYYQVKRLTDYIESLLSPASTYEGWLHHYHPQIYSKAEEKGNMIPKLQKARHAWLDSLAKEFKNKSVPEVSK